MTAKRLDKLAAQAMAGLLGGQRGEYYVVTPEELAKKAYAVADAMAAEKARRDQALAAGAG